MNLHFGVIGVGHFGKHYVRLLQQMENAELVGIATHALHEVSSLPKKVRQYHNAEELLEDKTIDCVIIATPPSTHAKLAISALEKGKHVLIEKPMAISGDEAERIAGAAQKNNRTCMIGHQYCYNDYIRVLKKEIGQKTIGNIVYLFAEHLYPGPIRLDVGCLWETATHELAIMDYLFPHARVIDIKGQMVDIAGSGRDDMTTAILTFDNGMVATLFAAWFAPKKVRRIMMAGSNGMALFDEKEKYPLTFFQHPYPKQESPELHTSHFFEITDSETYIPDVNAQEPLRNELLHFMECIRENTPPITDVNHGLRITKLLDEITKKSTHKWT